MRFIVFILLVQLTHCGLAQQRPQYSQYVFNNYLLNPALSGMENYTDVKIGYRSQWIGVADAPVTGFVSVNWALGNQYLWENALSFEEKGDNPMSHSYLQYYTASPAHHGVGFTAVADKAGQISNQTFNLTYAYHLQLSGMLNFSVGLAAGLNRLGINAGGLRMEHSADPALKNVMNNQYQPDLSAGLWLYGARFYTGLSVQQILPQKLSFTTTADYNKGKQVPHLFLTGGYKFSIAEEMYILPSAMLKYVQNVPFSVDLNAKAAYKDQFWIGVGLRKKDASILMAGFSIGHFLNLTYSYDFSTPGLNNINSNSHEIVLGFMLNNVYKVICPQKMW